MGIPPHAPHLALDHLVPRAIGAVGGIDLMAVAKAIEVHIFKEAVDDHAVVPIRRHVVDIVPPLLAYALQRGVIDIGRLGQDNVLERARRVLIVGLGAIGLGIGLYAHRARVDEPLRQRRRDHALRREIRPVVPGGEAIGDAEQAVGRAERCGAAHGHCRLRDLERERLVGGPAEGLDDDGDADGGQRVVHPRGTGLPHQSFGQVPAGLEFVRDGHAEFAERREGALGPGIRRGRSLLRDHLVLEPDRERRAELPGDEFANNETDSQGHHRAQRRATHGPQSVSRPAGVRRGQA